MDVLVIIFQIDKVRQFLLDHGQVYTFRKLRRKLGRDWMTDKRGGTKIHDVSVSMVGTGIWKNEEDLTKILVNFCRWSGFEVVEDWIEEIKRLNKGVVPSDGFLHKVVLVRKDVIIADCDGSDYIHCCRYQQNFSYYKKNPSLYPNHKGGHFEVTLFTIVKFPRGKVRITIESLGDEDG